jgi:putative mRNA 3-end processing factor
LVETIAASGAEKIMLTHGYAGEMARWLQERGYNAGVIPTIPDDPMEIDGDAA